MTAMRTTPAQVLPIWEGMIEVRSGAREGSRKESVNLWGVTHSDGQEVVQEEVGDGDFGTQEHSHGDDEHVRN